MNLSELVDCIPVCPNHWILSLGDKTRMLPEKWRNFRTECSHEQQVLIHELTNCQEFLHSQHVTQNFGSTDLNGPSSTRFIWGLASVTTARFEPTFLFILLLLICTIFLCDYFLVRCYYSIARFFALSLPSQFLCSV